MKYKYQCRTSFPKMIKMFETESKRLLKRANNCKPKELRNLLKQVEAAIQKSEGKDKDLVLAKLIITTKLTSIPI